MTDPRMPTAPFRPPTDRMPDQADVPTVEMALPVPAELADPAPAHVDLVAAEQAEVVERAEHAGVEFEVEPVDPAPTAHAGEPADAPDPDRALAEPEAAPAPADGEADPAAAGATAAGALVEPDVEGDEWDAAAHPGEIDPRIRDRRVAIIRAQGRRRLRILLTVVSVASALGIAWLVVQSPLLAVNDVTVQGTTRETQNQVIAAAGVRTGSALLFVDTGAVAARVEKLPWVATAKVTRELPNGLKIVVLERLPVAWVRRPVPPGSPAGTTGAAVLVDRLGRVLGDEPQPPAGLPELVGSIRLAAPGEPIAPSGPAGALGKLPDALRAQIASMSVKHGDVVLHLVAPPGGADPSAGEVKLGNLEQMTAKGAAAMAVLDQLTLGGEHVHYIDVRVPGAPATR